MKGLVMSRTDVEAHQRKHGFAAPHDIPTTTVEAITDKIRKAKGPNKTEHAFGLILEARKRRGEIDEYHYEGLTLRWGDGMRYTPDYVVFSFDEIILIEVKGAHIWDRDLVRFKGCRAEWKHRFVFEMHQRKQGEWRRLL